MTRMQTYTVTAGRGTGGQWVFQCTEFPRAVSRGRSLADAYVLMPAEIAAVAGVNPAPVEIDLVPNCTVIPVDEAQVTLPELVAESAAHEIYLTSNHEAVAVLVGSDAYERILNRIKELEGSQAGNRNCDSQAAKPYMSAPSPTDCDTGRP